MEITNLKDSPMELMYLAHVNFMPIDNARLVYSARCTPEHVRVRASIPSHIKPKPGYAEFLTELREHPEKHHILSPDLAFDPEGVFFIDYVPDQEGWAHTMQIHPAGPGGDRAVDYIAYRPEQLPKGTRWISRMPDQDAIALVEPGTAEPEGYTAEKKKGNVKLLAPHETFRCEIIVGALSGGEAARLETKIDQIVGQ
jgi:hypothetical protein